jgi:hypothetical protein
MNKTTDDVEDLDMVAELSAYDTVLGVEENRNMFDERFKDADFLITVRDTSEYEGIKALPQPFRYSAYAEFDETVLKID